MGRMHEAETAFREAIRIAPNFSNYLKLASFLKEHGKSQEAIAFYRNALNLPGPPEFRTALVERLAACGDAARAMQMLGPDTDLYTRFSRN